MEPNSNELQEQRPIADEVLEALSLKSDDGAGHRATSAAQARTGWQEHAPPPEPEIRWEREQDVDELPPDQTAPPPEPEVRYVYVPQPVQPQIQYVPVPVPMQQASDAPWPADDEGRGARERLMTILVVVLIALLLLIVGFDMWHQVHSPARPSSTPAHSLVIPHGVGHGT